MPGPAPEHDDEPAVRRDLVAARKRPAARTGPGCSPPSARSTAPSWKRPRRASRKQRRTLPPGTRWVTYAIGAPAAAGRPPAPCPARGRRRRPPSGSRSSAARRFGSPTASCSPTRRTGSPGSCWRTPHVPDDRRQQILGTRGAASDHRHAHWIPSAGRMSSGASVQTLVLWAPGRAADRGDRGAPQPGHDVRQAGRRGRLRGARASPKYGCCSRRPGRSSRWRRSCAPILRHGHGAA